MPLQFTSESYETEESRLVKIFTQVRVMSYFTTKYQKGLGENTTGVLREQSNC